MHGFQAMEKSMRLRGASLQLRNQMHAGFSGQTVMRTDTRGGGEPDQADLDFLLMERCPASSPILPGGPKSNLNNTKQIMCQISLIRRIWTFFCPHHFEFA